MWQKLLRFISMLLRAELRGSRLTPTWPHNTIELDDVGFGKLLRLWYGSLVVPGPLQLVWTLRSDHSGWVNLHSLHWILPLIQLHLRHHRQWYSRYNNPHPLICDYLGVYLLPNASTVILTFVRWTQLVSKGVGFNIRAEKSRVQFALTAACRRVQNRHYRD